MYSRFSVYAWDSGAYSWASRVGSRWANALVRRWSNSVSVFAHRTASGSLESTETVGVAVGDVDGPPGRFVSPAVGPPPDARQASTATTTATTSSRAPAAMGSSGVFDLVGPDLDVEQFASGNVEGRHPAAGPRTSVTVDAAVGVLSCGAVAASARPVRVRARLTVCGRAGLVLAGSAVLAGLVLAGLVLPGQAPSRGVGRRGRDPQRSQRPRVIGPAGRTAVPVRPVRPAWRLVLAPLRRHLTLLLQRFRLPPRRRFLPLARPDAIRAPAAVPAGPAAIPVPAPGPCRAAGSPSREVGVPSAAGSPYPAAERRSAERSPPPAPTFRPVSPQACPVR